MEELETPRIQDKLAGIRDTLQRLSNSMTEDDISEAEVSKQSVSSSSSNYKPFSSLSDNAAKSQDWNSYDSFNYKPLDSEYPPAGLKSTLYSPQVPEDSIQKKLKAKENEIKLLKSNNFDFRDEVRTLKEILVKKDKEIKRLTADKEAGRRAEEELHKSLKESRKRNEGLSREVEELRENSEFVEVEKRHLENELKQALEMVERLKRTLKIKEDAIMALYQSRNDLEKEMGSKSQCAFKFDKEGSGRKVRNPEKRGISNSPERPEFNFTDRGEDISYKIMCSEAMKIIGVTSSGDFYSKLLHLRQYHSKYKRCRKLIDKIAGMIVQCSPAGSFAKEPNIHQIWKWITGLLEEYMRIKKAYDGDAVIRVCEMLGVEDLESGVSRIAQILKARKA